MPPARRPTLTPRAARRVLAACLSVLALSGAPFDVGAIDHKNLDEGRPLRLEDPYVIPWRSFAVETGLAFDRPRAGGDHGLLAVELLYGAAPNLQVGLSTSASSNSAALDDGGRPGDLRVGALYNFNQETLRAPALGLKLAAILPTAPGSRAADLELSGLLKKSAGRLGLHCGLARLFRGQAGAGERNGAWRAAIGASWPAGAPLRTRTLLLADLFAEQGVVQGEERIVGTEIGVRHQWLPRVVLDAGAGTEMRGPADRATFFAAAGLSYGW